MKKTDELIESGMLRSDAKFHAENWIKEQSALHNPDQIAGGFANNVTGVGDSGINASIGSQWKNRISIVDEIIDEVVRTTSYEELNKMYLNVKLITLEGEYYE